MDATSLEEGLNKRASHIFRNIEGHFYEDTPARRIEWVGAQGLAPLHIFDVWQIF